MPLCKAHKTEHTTENSDSEIWKWNDCEKKNQWMEISEHSHITSKFDKGM